MDSTYLPSQTLPGKDARPEFSPAASDAVYANPRKAATAARLSRMFPSPPCDTRGVKYRNVS
jgi:hypothetical protein